MDITCQYCGTTAVDRVFCPNCKRRMQPATSSPAAQEPAAEVSPETLAEFPPPAYPATPQYPPPHGGYGQYPPPPPGWMPPAPQVGPWGGPLSPVMLFDRKVTTTTPRLTVCFRLILAIPALIVLIVFDVGMLFASIAAWFAALFTARVPDGLYEFISYVTAYRARVYSYTFMLTDVWPTISKDAAYPVVVQFPGPERLNRAAVLFRGILAIPAWFVSVFALAGLEVISVVIWATTLAAGRMPVALFDSAAAVSRYRVRFDSYVGLLTSAYPSGLFVGVHDDLRPPIEARPTLLPPQRSTAARNLVIVMIVLGVGFQALDFALQSLPTIESQFRTAYAEIKLSDAYDKLDFSSSSCQPGPSESTCLQALDQQRVEELQQFQSSVDGIHFPSDVSDYVTVLKTATTNLISAYQVCANATSAATCDSVQAGISVPQAVFNEAENALDDKLEGH